MQTEPSIEALVRRKDAAATTLEYNCELRRLYPWRPIAETKRPITEFGVIWVTLAGGDAVDPHDHDEEETFIVVSGAARLTIGSQSTEIAAGDVAYVPRFSRHRLENLSATEPFVMIDVYWDWQGRVAADLPQPEGAAA